MGASWERNCHPAVIDCQANRNDLIHIVNPDQGLTLGTVAATVSSASNVDNLPEFSMLE